MIYKFIDSNGAEITVNSLSSLEALVESETVKENTKVKAGLRGKWTPANNIEELNDIFNKKMEVLEEPEAPQEDIKSFITKEEPVEQEVISEPIKQEVIVEKTQPIIKNEGVPANTFENDLKSDEELENEERNRDTTYDDNNVIGINIFDAVGICFKKYFVLEGRASRSEYWFFYLFSLPFYFTPALIGGETGDIFFILFLLILIIPGLTVTVRRFHDLDKSGWWVFMSIIPFIGGIILLVMCASRGTEGKNQFGEYPLQLKEKNNS